MELSRDPRAPGDSVPEATASQKQDPGLPTPPSSGKRTASSLGLPPVASQKSNTSPPPLGLPSSPPASPEASHHADRTTGPGQGQPERTSQASARERQPVTPQTPPAVEQPAQAPSKPRESKQQPLTSQTGNIGRRFKSALKGIFGKDTGDGKQIEKIQEQHWADD